MDHLQEAEAALQKLTAKEGTNDLVALIQKKQQVKNWLNYKLTTLWTILMY